MMTHLFSTILANKHTSGAGLVYAIAKFGCPLAQVWFPGHEAQLKSTAELLEGAAVFYGLAAAGDSARSTAAHEETKVALSEMSATIATTAGAAARGDTSMLTKVATNPPVVPPVADGPKTG